MPLSKKYDTGHNSSEKSTVFLPTTGDHLVTITEATYLETAPSKFSRGNTGCNLVLEVQDTDGNTFLLQRFLNIKDSYNDGTGDPRFKEGVKHQFVKTIKGDATKDSYISLIADTTALIGRLVLVKLESKESEEGRKYIQLTGFGDMDNSIPKSNNVESSGLLESCISKEIYAQYDFEKESFKEVLYSSCFPKTNPEFVFLVPKDAFDENGVKIGDKDRYNIFKETGTKANEFFESYIKIVPVKPSKVSFRFGYIKVEGDTEKEQKNAAKIEAVYLKAGFKPVTLEAVVALANLPTYQEQKDRLAELVAEHSPLLV